MEGGLSSARSNKDDSGHSVPSPSGAGLRFSASSILHTTNVSLSPLLSPDPMTPACAAEAPAGPAPAPASSSWNQTLKVLVAQSSAISLSPPPSPLADVVKGPSSSSSSDATTKKAVRFQIQQNVSPCIPSTTCRNSTHNSCRSSVVMTTASRRRYQRRNSKTPAMLMQSMSTSHASQPLPSQSKISPEFALNSFSFLPSTIISSSNEANPIAGSTKVDAPRISTSSAGSNIGAVLLGMNECSSTSACMDASNNTVSDCETQRIKSMPPRIVSRDFGIGMEQEEQSSGECCKRRKLL